MPDIHDETKAAARAACIDTTVRFFAALDRFDHAACVDLMTPDAEWDRVGTVFAGRAAVLAMLAQRIPSRRTCHVLANLSATLIDAEHARVEFCLLSYEGTVVAEGEPPVGRLASIRRGVDELRLGQQGWRIARKRSELVFNGGPATAVPTRAAT